LHDVGTLNGTSVICAFNVGTSHRTSLDGIIDKEGGFVNRPPLLDGSNYDY